MESDGLVALDIMVAARLKGGRPTGTTKKRKQEMSVAVLAYKNEIAQRYNSELDDHQSKNKRMNKGHLMEIIKEFKMKNKVSDDIGISDTTIRQRVMCGSIFSHVISGHRYPLLPLESLFVATIIQMARIRQSLSPS